MATATHLDAIIIRNHSSADTIDALANFITHLMEDIRVTVEKTEETTNGLTSTLLVHVDKHRRTPTHTELTNARHKVFSSIKTLYDDFKHITIEAD